MLLLVLLIGCESNERTTETPAQNVALAVEGSVATKAADDLPNKPPEIVSVKLEPRVLTSGTPITAVVETRDFEGDPVALRCEWRRNDEIIFGEWSQVLSTSEFKKGDAIVAAVTPSDGISEGDTRISAPVILGNRPPAILSNPSHALTGSAYFYQVNAVDPDGDPLTYSLENPPAGAKLDAGSGVLQWELPPEKEGSFFFRITVSDGEAASVQEFPITLTSTEGHPSQNTR